MCPMLCVGLTGNIASGKTFAARAFADLGAYIIDADYVAHDLLERGTPVYDRIVHAFGHGILDPDGGINRGRLGRIVFFDEEQRQRLNQITHPGVSEEIGRRIDALEREHGEGIVIVDAALMVETGGYRRFPLLIVVVCDPALQLARLMERDGLSETEARARMQSQMAIEKKKKLAQYTIDTSGTPEQTLEQVASIYRQLQMQSRTT